MTSNFDVKMDEYLPLRDVVFKTLRQAILKGELEPGERLMEIQLAERLGVSRTPIREAIRKLEPRWPGSLKTICGTCWRCAGPWRSWRWIWPARG